MNLALLDTGVLENLLDGLHGPAEQVHVKLLELGAGESLREVVATLERLDFDASRLLGGERALGLLNLALELAQSAEVLRDVGAGLLLVLLEHVLDDAVVEVFASQMGISSRREYLEHAVLNGQKRNVERAPAKIIDEDLRLSALLVETVGDGSSGGLVDDTENVETSNLAGILRCLTLGVVEVGGDSDNGVAERMSQPTVLSIATSWNILT